MYWFIVARIVRLFWDTVVFFRCHDVRSRHHLSMRVYIYVYIYMNIYLVQNYHCRNLYICICICVYLLYIVIHLYTYIYIYIYIYVCYIGCIPHSKWQSWSPPISRQVAKTTRTHPWKLLERRIPRILSNRKKKGHCLAKLGLHMS